MSELLSLKSRKLVALGNILLVGFMTPGIALADRPADAPLRSTEITQPAKEFGVMTDMAEQTKPEDAQRAVELIQNAGFNLLKETVVIDAGNQGFLDINSTERTKIVNSLEAATEAGLPVDIAMEQHAWVTVNGNRYRPPLRPYEQTGFCRVGAELVHDYPIIKDASVGVEPNNSPFWWPQYVDGKDAVAQPYVSLLGKCYDILKAARPDDPVTVIGGELASSGNDDYTLDKGDHSPSKEIANMCDAYAASKRTRPLMDEFSQHWYPLQGESTLVSHDSSTSRGVGDYQILMSELGCFVQPGKQQQLPKLIFGEGGLPTDVPRSDMYRYRFNKPLKTSVAEGAAANYIVSAIHEVNCNQPNTVGLINFQFVDDRTSLNTGLVMPPPDIRGLSSAFSGLKMKLSYKAVTSELSKVNSGTDCP